MTANHDIPAQVKDVVAKFAEYPQLLAVGLAGSYAANNSDTKSDFDLYFLELSLVTLSEVEGSVR